MASVLIPAGAFLPKGTVRLRGVISGQRGAGGGGGGACVRQCAFNRFGHLDRWRCLYMWRNNLGISGAGGTGAADPFDATPCQTCFSLTLNPGSTYCVDAGSGSAGGSGGVGGSNTVGRDSTRCPRRRCIGCCWKCESRMALGAGDGTFAGHGGSTRFLRDNVLQCCIAASTGVTGLRRAWAEGASVQLGGTPQPCAGGGSGEFGCAQRGTFDSCHVCVFGGRGGRSAGCRGTCGGRRHRRYCTYLAFCLTNIICTYSAPWGSWTCVYRRGVGHNCLFCVGGGAGAKGGGALGGGTGGRGDNGTACGTSGATGPSGIPGCATLQYCYWEQGE